MDAHSGKLSQFLYLFKTLGPRALLRIAGSMAYSLNHYFILGKNLEAPLGGPQISRSLGALSLMSEQDIADLNRSAESLPPDDRRELVGRLCFYKSGFKNCYVIKSGDDIAYLQWIIYPSENAIIRSRYSNKFYPLTDRQIMVENAFAFPRFRGRGYLPFATSRLLDLAKSQGYSSVVCYIRNDRIASLNEFIKMGFKIRKMVKEYKLVGKVWRTL